MKGTPGTALCPRCQASKVHLNKELIVFSCQECGHSWSDINRSAPDDDRRDREIADRRRQSRTDRRRHETEPRNDSSMPETSSLESALLREMATLEEKVEDLRASAIRWRDLYEGSTRRCAKLQNQTFGFRRTRD